MKKILSITLIVLAVGGLIAFKLISNKQKIDAKKQPVDHSNVAIPVSVFAAQNLPVETRLVKTGTLIPFDEADIIAGNQGKVTSLNFDLGSQVNKGAVMANVDMQIAQLSLSDAQQRVKKLENDYQTYKELLAGDGTTQAKVDEIKLSLDNARNQVSQIRKQIGDYSIIAPISGVVVAKNTVKGEFVNPGTVIGKMVDVSRLKVQVLVGENDAYQLKAGQPVKIKTDIYPDQNFTGIISFISPQGDKAHNYPVEIVLNNNSKNALKAGTFVQADFSQNATENALQIPREALVESVKNPYVYVLENNLAKTRKIQVGRSLGSNIEVTNGLKEGEDVIVSGQINLTENTKVEVVK
jgi:multidrug efflux system membrane fusion protein